jgi:hypothetical protein
MRDVYERDLVLEQKRDQDRRISRRGFELGANLGARNKTFARATVGIETSTESQSVMTVMCDLYEFRKRVYSPNVGAWRISKKNAAGMISRRLSSSCCRFRLVSSPKWPLQSGS